MSSEDFVCIITANNSKADADEIRAWPFKKKISGVGKLYTPSALILRYGILARNYNVGVSDVDTTVMFRTRDKAIATITDLGLKIIGETGNDTE